jgi:hypothetical protein
MTRTGLDWTERFSPLADALATLDLPPALIDGEVVALDAQGNPSFSALQAALKAGDSRLAYFAFDLLVSRARISSRCPTSSARNASKPCSPKRPTDPCGRAYHRRRRKAAHRHVPRRAGRHHRQARRCALSR